MKVTSENALVVFGALFAFMIIYLVIGAIIKFIFARREQKEIFEIYHKNDIKGLRKFLKQPSADWKTTNGEQLGFSEIENQFLYWNYESPKRLIKIFIDGQNLKGVLDARKWSELLELDCSNNQLTAINLSGCAKLRRLNCSNNLLSTLNLDGCKELKELDCSDNQLTDEISNPFSFVISKTEEAMQKDADQYLEQGDNETDPKKAITAYEMAIKLNPRLEEAYINMGLTYAEKMNDTNRALYYYNEVLRINPHSNDAFFNMGCAYARIKEFDKAIECFNNAIKYNPEDFEAYWLMGCCYKDKGDEETQIKCATTAAELGDKRARSWLLDKGFVSVSFKNNTENQRVVTENNTIDDPYKYKERTDAILLVSCHSFNVG